MVSGNEVALLERSRQDHHLSHDVDATQGKVGKGQVPDLFYPPQSLPGPPWACICPNESRLRDGPLSTAEQVTGGQ